MKNLAFFLINIFTLAGFAQQTPSHNDAAFESMVEAEMKAAYRTSNFRANLNTGNYDVGHTTLELTVDPEEQYISGIITTVFTAKSAMATLTFDLAHNLDVTAVTLNGGNVNFSQNSNDELVINLGTTLQAGQQATVAVRYNGAPSDEQDAFILNTHSGRPILATLSEPYGAKEWWPCKQDLIDKIEGLDVYITAPSQYVAVSNGLEVGQTTTGGNKTTHFRHNYPIPAYLVAIAVTNYTVYTQNYTSAMSNFPVVNYLYPESSAQNQPSLSQTLDIMNFYESTFEAYPFNAEKYGHAQWNQGGGMEHTTVSFMGSFGRELIAHELAHQWFGDKITCGSWKDIWLNEGFATYLSGLVVENQDGASGFRSWRAQKITSVVSSPNGAVYLTDTDTISDSRIFSSRLTYNKGAMVLHMLRYKLGDTAFYQGIKNYLADSNLAYAYAKTPDFQQHMEVASGVNLAEFFNDWVYNQGYPIYNVVVNGSGNGNTSVTISQTQSDPSVSFFEMPVPVRFYGTNGETHEVILNNTYNGQQFSVPVNFTIDTVEVNADYHIISAENTAVLGTAAALAKNNVSLYPNPANSLLNLQLPEGITVTHAVFYNALGQKVLETNSDTQWNVGALIPGVHFIKLETSAGNVQLKFVKG